MKREQLEELRMEKCGYCEGTGGTASMERRR